MRSLPFSRSFDPGPGEKVIVIVGSDIGWAAARRSIRDGHTNVLVYSPDSTPGAWWWPTKGLNVHVLKFEDADISDDALDSLARYLMKIGSHEVYVQTPTADRNYRRSKSAA